MRRSRRIKVELSLPETLVRQFTEYARARRRSISSLALEALIRFLEEDTAFERARNRFLKRVIEAPDRGTGGVFNWTREELYER